MYIYVYIYIYIYMYICIYVTTVLAGNGQIIQNERNAFRNYRISNNSRMPQHFSFLIGRCMQQLNFVK